MASPGLTETAAPETGDPLIDGLLSGYKWVLGDDRTIDWSISGGFEGAQWPNIAEMQAAMQTAVNIVSQYTNLKFNFVGVFNNPDAAAQAGSEINLWLDTTHFVFDEDDESRAAAFYPKASLDALAGEIVFNFNPGGADYTTFAPGSQGFETLLHELGHALGLKHPHKEDDDDSEAGRTTFEDIDEDGKDHNLYTVMSYFTAHLDETMFQPATFSVLDVLALQSLYGVNTDLNATNTRISVDETQDIRTIFDPSGFDIVDASGESEAWTIVLPYLFYSDDSPYPAGYALPSADDASDTPETFWWLLGVIEDARGSDHDDTIYGNAVSNFLYGGGGGDTIFGGGGSDYIRGEDGNDSIDGGSAFDDINGNRGNDNLRGGEGNDWVVGGQDEDSIRGDNGNDIVYGNLGNDTVRGGNGDDWVRGGQGDDYLYGDAGADFMSGDRGSDVLYGGEGGDRFNLIVGAGIDRVMDFNTAEGDRVSIEGALPYSLSFVGGDAIIDIGNGDQMILAGVSSADQLGVWIYQA